MTHLKMLRNVGADPDLYWFDEERQDIYPLSPPRPWAAFAYCDPDNCGEATAALFMPEDGQVADPRAPRLCERFCPVREECYEYGRRIAATVGVWGGVDFGLEFLEAERARKRAARLRRAG